MKLAKTFWILVLITNVGCHNNREKLNSFQKNEVSINPQKIYDERNRKTNDDFLFLDFWLKMSVNEFNFIKDSLVKNGKLQNIDNSLEYAMVFNFQDLVDKNRLTYSKIIFRLSPRIVNDKLIGIELNSQHVDGYLSEFSKEEILNFYSKKIIDMYSSKYGKFEKKEDVWGTEYEWQISNKTIKIRFNNSSVLYRYILGETTRLNGICEILYLDKEFANLLEEKEKQKLIEENNETIKKGNETKREI